jgi:hypothetical protein
VIAATKAGGQIDFGCSDEDRERRKCARRPAWQIPRQTVAVYCQSKKERLQLIGARVLQMLRRATFELLFSSAQVEQLIGDDLMPHSAARVEAMVTLFTVTTDPENAAAHEWLSRAEYRLRDINMICVDQNYGLTEIYLRFVRPMLILM